MSGTSIIAQIFVPLRLGTETCDPSKYRPSRLNCIKLCRKKAIVMSVCHSVSHDVILGFVSGPYMYLLQGSDKFIITSHYY